MEGGNSHTASTASVPTPWWESPVVYLEIFVPIFLLIVSWGYYTYMLYPQNILDRLRRQGIPGCNFRPFVGNIPEIQEMRKAADKETPTVKLAIPFLEKMGKTFGGTYTYCYGSTPRLVTTDPALIRQIYVARNNDFPKLAAGSAFRLLGNGLSNSSGELWERQRRMMGAAFSTKAVKEIVGVVGEAVKESVDKWLDQLDSATSASFAMHEELSKLALETIGRAVFGAEIAGMGIVAKEAIGVLGRYIDALPKFLASGGLFSGYRWMPTPLNRQLLDDETAIKTLLLGLISRRKGAQVSRKEEVTHGVSEELPSVDLLEFMISAVDHDDGTSVSDTKTGKGKVGIDESGHMTTQQLMEECITLAVAGHETVAATLTWTMFLLAKFPEWQTRVREEVFAVRTKGQEVDTSDKVFTFDQLEELRQLHMVILECLRIYPPSTVLARKCETNKSLVGLKCPMGTEVILPLIQIHHQREFWGQDADVFNPERFAGGKESAAKHPLAYLPFSVGPRDCIGQAFALVEMKAVLAIIVSAFKWRLAPNYRHCPSTGLTLRPKYGLPLILEKLT